MTDYLLDTNHASPLVTVGHALRERVLRALDNGHTFALSIPVLVETVYGISVLPRAQSNLQEWQRLRANIACYIPDEADAMIDAELRVTLRRGDGS